MEIAPILVNSLDQGEAAVIQLALDKNSQTVCTDEAAEAALVHVMAAHRPRAWVCGQCPVRGRVRPVRALTYPLR